jgi:outer membrane receptor protein involved in Fe transport
MWSFMLDHCSKTLVSMLICFGSLPANLAAQSARVEGMVRDSVGAVIAHASVKLEGNEYRSSTTSDEKGRFVFSQIPTNAGTVEVSAKGFAPRNQSWRLDADGTAYVEVVLQPLSVSEQVTVSAARTELRLSESPGSTILLSSTDANSAPALRMDDVLRQVPGFSLFRRSSSRTANASNQGVSLRGVGGTAASRALVLEDGIPLVDAFGGWVYWDRVPPEALSNIEVFRGGASNLYGSDALGGVIQFFTRQPQTPAMRLDFSYGNQRTPDLSFWTGTRANQWDFALASEMFHTDGFIVVPLSLRGTIDTPASSEDATVDLTVGHRLGAAGRVFARGSFFTESRNNGTPLQTNSTRMGEGDVGLDQQFGSGNSIALRGYGLVQGYDQVFSSIASNRNSESLTDLQHVPEQVGGGGVQWAHLLGKSQTLIGGLDFMEVMGASDEQLFTKGTHTRNNAAGGRQRILGFFGEDILRFHQKWTFILGVRFDDWNNFDASSICTPVFALCPSPSAIYAARSETAFDPRLSVLRSLNSHVSLTASIYRAFRAPTLNELYRTFRLGNVLTYNNPSLIAERLTGAEAGLNVSGWNHKLEFRGSLFWSDIVDPVQNVTISSTPTLITREKENLGRTGSRGFEIDGVSHLGRNIQISAGYEYTAATVLSYPAPAGGVSLVGLDVAEIPHNVFTWEARYWNPSQLLLSVQGRFAGQQYDDDQNTLPLKRFYTMDLEIGRAFTRHLELFAAAENLLDQRYQVARTPIVNIGPPILYRAGLRLIFPPE